MSADSRYLDLGIMNESSYPGDLNCDHRLSSSAVMIHIDNVHNLNQSSPKLSVSDDDCTSIRNDDTQSNFSFQTQQQQPNWIQKVVTHCQHTITKRGLKQKLQQFYQSVTLPCVAWLDDGRDMLIKDYYIELQLDANSQLPIEKIFDKVNGVKPTRILIEGQPGYGKTTLTSKIAYDWATREKYLRDFNLLFVIPLGMLQGQSIHDAMQTIAMHCGFNNSQKMMSLIEENQEKTLLILDGLDELATSERESVLKIIYRQIYSEMCVVITCRTGLFKLEQEEKVNLFGQISIKKEFYDKRIVIVGVKHQDRWQFLNKFMSSDKANAVMEHLEKLTQPIDEIFKSPLLIILLAFILQKGTQFDLINRTNLYKNLFNCIIRRSLEKSKIKIGKKFDLFDLNKPEWEEYQELMCQFGQRVLDNIKDNKSFDDDELNNEIYKLGFLVNHKHITHFDSCKHFEGFHLSILEFAAAFYLWNGYHKNNKVFSRQSLTTINEIFLQSGETSLILPFLIGLMESNARSFFAQLKQYSCMYSTKPIGFWNMIEESQSLRIDHNLIDFIPCEISLKPDDASGECKAIVQKGMEIGRMITIQIVDKQSLSLVPDNVCVPVLSVVLPLSSGELEDEDFVYLKKISCDVFSLTILSKLDNERDILKYFSLFAAIRAQKRILILHDDQSPTVLLKLLQEDIAFQKTKFYALSCNLSDKATDLELIEILLSNNQVKELQVKLKDDSQDTATNIINYASASDYLDSLSFFGHHSQDVDLRKLTQCGQKQWKVVCICGARTICNKSIKIKECISCLTILSCGIDLDSATAVTKVNPSKLECNSNTLRGIQQKVEKTWSGYKSIKELVVLLDKTSLYTHFWRDLKFFAGLDTLQIVTPKEFFHLFSDESLIQLERLNITRLIISWDMFQIISEHEQFKGGVKLRLTNVFPKTLKDVELVISLDLSEVELVKELNSILSEFLIYFKHRKLNNFSIVSSRDRVLQCVLQGEAVDFSVFNVKHFVRKQNYLDHATTDLRLLYIHVLSFSLK